MPLRDPREWDETYLLNLPVGEFDWLEVKSRRGLDLTEDYVRERDVKQNLSKALSAFANTGGGILVFGLCDPETEWEVDGGGIPMNIKGGTREWLEDIIPTLTDLPLEDFNVYKILPTSEGSQIQEGRALYVIEVGDSKSAPHQASDNRYYARVAGKSRPIGHRLVLDIANRRQHPIFEVSFEIEWERRWSDILPGREPEVKPFLKMCAVNQGRVMAEYFKCDVLIPEEISPVSDEYRDLVEIEGSVYVSQYSSNRRSNARPMKGPSAFWFEPILPGRQITGSFELDTIFFEGEDSYPPVRWRISADNAREARGKADFGETPILNSKQNPT